MLRGSTWGWYWLCIAVAWQSRAIQAQIYKFEEAAFPPPRVLQTLYAFYIYAQEDAPAGSETPYMQFTELVGHSTDPRATDQLLENYKGLQISTLLFRDFWLAINASKYCSTEDDKRLGVALHAEQLLTRRGVDIFSFTVPMGKKKPQLRIPITDTGIYILVISNCGDLTDAVVSGSVIGRNAYGFLPGSEFHKMPFYWYLAGAYGLLAALWVFLCCSWSQELFHIHYCIFGVLLLGMLEAFWWWAFLDHFNHYGILLKWLFVVAILFSVVKSVLSYMLVLVASLGWGVTKPQLEWATVVKIQVIAFLYIVLSFIREIVMSFRNSHTLSFSFVLLCLLPVALLNGGIFYWVFTALGKLIETLREQQQTEKLQLFRKLWCVLMCACGIATFTVLFQMFDTVHSISTRWHYQWFLADGVSHIVFGLVLVTMMYLWAPNENSQRFAYSQQIASEDKEESTNEPSASEIGNPDVAA